LGAHTRETHEKGGNSKGGNSPANQLVEWAARPDPILVGDPILVFETQPCTREFE
jgi:hypothetical protein